MDEYRQLANGTYVSKARLIAADKHPLHSSKTTTKQLFRRPYVLVWPKRVASDTNRLQGGWGPSPALDPIGLCGLPHGYWKSTGLCGSASLVGRAWSRLGLQELHHRSTLPADRPAELPHERAALPLRARTPPPAAAALEGLRIPGARALRPEGARALASCNWSAGPTRVQRDLLCGPPVIPVVGARPLVWAPF